MPIDNIKALAFVVIALSHLYLSANYYYCIVSKSSGIPYQVKSVFIFRLVIAFFFVSEALYLASGSERIVDLWLVTPLAIFAALSRLYLLFWEIRNVGD